MSAGSKGAASVLAATCSATRRERKRRRCAAQAGRRGKLRFDLAFNGLRFSGWQPQPNAVAPSVYTLVARAWGQASGEPGFGPVAAARLDAGVSADHQICSVRTQRQWTPAQLEQLREDMNTHLPTDVIQCLCVMSVPVAFHAINSPKWKIYRYEVVQTRDLAQDQDVSQDRNTDARYWRRSGGAIDPEKTRTACALFVGTHDFRRFTSRSGPWAEPDASGEPAANSNRGHLPRSAVRTVLASAVTIHASEGETFLQITFKGSGFLKHQVRRMVGAAVAHGANELELRHLRAALVGGTFWDTVHRTLPAPLRSFEAPACGLTLQKIHVP